MMEIEQLFIEFNRDSHEVWVFGGKGIYFASRLSGNLVAPSFLTGEVGVLAGGASELAWGLNTHGGHTGKESEQNVCGGASADTGVEESSGAIARSRLATQLRAAEEVEGIKTKPVAGREALGARGVCRSQKAAVAHLLSCGRKTLGPPERERKDPEPEFPRRRYRTVAWEWKLLRGKGNGAGPRCLAPGLVGEVTSDPAK